MSKKSNSKTTTKSRSAAPAKVVKKTPARNTPRPKTSMAPVIGPAFAPKEITPEMIAKRAYEIYVGGTGGDETYNWLRAERELRGL